MLFTSSRRHAAVPLGTAVPARPCSPGRAPANIEQICARPGHLQYAKRCRQLRRDTGIAYDQADGRHPSLLYDQQSSTPPWHRPNRMRVAGDRRAPSRLTRPSNSSPVALGRIPSGNWRAPPIRRKTTRATQTTSRANLRQLAKAAGVALPDEPYRDCAERSRPAAIDHAEVTDGEGRFQRIWVMRFRRRCPWAA